ncbi:hypothetical protein GCM10010279_61590 [Streptomyces mutabilis]|nr:hypothetical protein GCM10010279_61590 [Streptomyces mutabilis]
MFVSAGRSAGGRSGSRRDGTAAPLSPDFAVPPLHPDHPPRPAVPRRPTRPRRCVRPDGATVSGLFTVLCVATLLVTLAVAY